MSLPCRIAGLSPLLLIVVLGACTGEGGSNATVTPGSTPTVTAVLTPTATPVPAATVTPESSPSPVPAATPSPSPEPEAPHAAPIEPDPGVESLGDNVVSSVSRARASLNLDPVALAEGMGITPPPCAGLVFYLSWQVRYPYPPTDVDIEVYWMRMGGRELIGEGPSGQASGGCGEFQVVNDSDEWVTVEVRYIIGELTG
jgi:hypothetical protein